MDVIGKTIKKNVLVFGVGINDAEYTVRVQRKPFYVDGKKYYEEEWVCPFYRTWTNLLMRHYCKSYKLRIQTYEDTAICEEWFRFSSFKCWMEKQDWEGKQLDKDLLIRGNKLYSSNTCIFIDPKVNTFIIERKSARGEYMLGVSFHKMSNKLRADCRNPFTGKKEFLGTFDNEQEAHEAWLKRKTELATMLAAEQNDPRVAKALIDRYTNYK